VAPEH